MQQAKRIPTEKKDWIDKWAEDAADAFLKDLQQTIKEALNR